MASPKNPTQPSQPSGTSPQPAAAAKKPQAVPKKNGIDWVTALIMFMVLMVLLVGVGVLVYPSFPYASSSAVQPAAETKQAEPAVSITIDQNGRMVGVIRFEGEVDKPLKFDKTALEAVVERMRRGVLPNQGQSLPVQSQPPNLKTEPVPVKPMAPVQPPKKAELPASPPVTVYCRCGRWGCACPPMQVTPQAGWKVVR